MKAVAEYRKNAEGCRKLAQELAKPEQRKMLEQMANTWDRLADQREKSVQDD